MPKFNAKTSKKPSVKKADVNEGMVYTHEGGVGEKLSVKEELATLALTSFVGDSFYRSDEEVIARIRELVELEPEFAAKCALYARHTAGMRSVSHVLADAIVNTVKGESWTRRFVDKVIFRVDDMTEILSLQLQRDNRNIPNALKKGLAGAFSKFDAYQLAKYRGEGKEVSLIDVVNLVHPKPTEKNGEALQALVKGKLRSVDTWESKLSKAGKEKTFESKARAKDEAWSEMVASRKIPYMALVMNLRNIVEQSSDEVLKIALEMLVDPKLIKKSKIFPFQYLTAYMNVKNRSVKTALNKAIEIALDNIPVFDGDTLIVVDHSDSMGSGVGSNKFTGDLFGSAIWKKNPGSDLMAFGTEAAYADLDDGDTLLSLAESAGRVKVGWHTNMHMAFKLAKKRYDRIFIFSDEQVAPSSQRGQWGGSGRTSTASSFNAYKQKFDVDPWIYSFDLGGYGNTQFKSTTNGRVVLLSGFSETIFDIVDKHEVNPHALVAEIEKIEL